MTKQIIAHMSQVHVALLVEVELLLVCFAKLTGPTYRCVVAMISEASEIIAELPRRRRPGRTAVAIVALGLLGSGCAGRGALSASDSQSGPGLVRASKQAGAGTSECPGEHTPEFAEQSPDELYLDVSGSIAQAFIVADFREQVREAELLELELHRPDGSVHRHSFMHHSVELLCRGCDPTPDGPPDQCDNACSLTDVGPARPDIPPEVINQYGRYTVVLRRPSAWARKTATFTVGSDLPYDRDPACTESPEQVGPYVRSECGAGILPVDHKTIFGATRVTYTRGECSVNVLMRIAHVGGATDHNTPRTFHDTALGQGRVETFPEGDVRISERNGRSLVAWLGPRLVVVDAARIGPDERALIQELLTVFPSTP